MYAADQENTDNNNHDRERLALYLTGLLPLHDEDEARAVLDLCRRLIPILAESQREREDALG